MEKMSRKLELPARIERLEKRHLTLSQQIDALDRNRYLTAAEELVLHDLKRQRLAAKDELVSLQLDPRYLTLRPPLAAE
jgi:hypothetical protein